MKKIKFTATLKTEYNTFYTVPFFEEAPVFSSCSVYLCFYTYPENDFVKQLREKTFLSLTIFLKLSDF